MFHRVPLFGLALCFAAACAVARSAPVAAPAPPAPPAPVAIEALPVEAAVTPPAPAENPFTNAELYADPAYQEKVETSIRLHPDQAALLARVKGSATALWIDRIASVKLVEPALVAVEKRAKELGRAVLPVFVVYNLPNRDCAAKASSGELAAEAGGEAAYRSQFIDPIAQAFAAHPQQRVAVVLEPDSLANLVTNLNVPKCAASQHVYENSVAYAVARLSLPNVFIYLDAAHAGWLGWDGNRARMAEVAKRVLIKAGGVDRIRGFATNISNYTPLEGDEGKRLEPSNPCPNELSFVEKFAANLAAQGVSGRGFIIDTARNGRVGTRARWGSWCNVKGAGLGERPRAAPRPLIDAYYWVKPPGDSDGTADSTAARFDQSCVSPDSVAGAPEAGAWFDAYFLNLAQNANPPL